MTATRTPPPARTGYLAVLALPGALRVFLPAMLGRLSFAMVALALLLLVQARTGSFAAAGLATGAFGLANVLASPARARLVDARGQRPVLVALAVAHALGLVGVLAVVRVSAPVAVVVATAALAGLAMPPLGAAMRVVWAALVPDARMRTRAYSLDAVGEEVVFTVGPLLVAALVAVADPEVAVLASAAASVLGTLGMTSSRLSRAQGGRPTPPREATAGGAERAARRRPADPLRQPLVIPLLVMLLGVGAVLGSVEVAVAALAERAGSTALAGPLLAAFAAGSAVGGLAYGTRAWRAPARIRLVVLVAAMLAATALLAGVAAGLPAAPDALALLLLGAALVPVGLFLAPAMVSGYLLADAQTAPSVRTEASAWVNTAVNTGVALAAAGVGAVVDAAGPVAGIVVGGLAALVVASIAAPSLLRRRVAVERAAAEAPAVDGAGL
ncbi:putative MFS family arabinose efflux permease [Clavibacter michiganensis]|uniref:MFS transporter n=1 Tax=Clavibacter michiganensis TaxID=28447 RepID=UPI001956C27E|nr:MFS transporter [Clavibacter michiganensis]MBM7412031.1 putative MFS family arabinose efflux permease [Clavibacter michiganensis]